MRAILSSRKALSVLGASALAFAAVPASAQAPESARLTSEGPGGRSALSSWTLALDPSNRGLAQGWQAGGFAGRTVAVPNVVDALDIKGAAGWRNYNGSIAWYRTTFRAPAPATYALSFASANYRATVFVDGQAVTTHTGSYLPFEARAALAEGTHSLVVRVDSRNPAAQAHEGFHRTWFNWGGLNGAVSVREIGASELLEPTVSVLLSPDSPRAESARLLVRMRVRNHGPARTLAPRGTLSRGATVAAIAFSPQEVGEGETVSMSATVTVANPALWSPQDPNLYDLELSEGSESSFSAHIGLRQLSWHGGLMYLNGERLQLHGASLQQDARGHGDALTPADDDQLVSELKAIGANAVRSQHPLDPALLERLDAAGILVWQGVGPVEGAGNWYATTPALLRAAEAQATTAVRALALHPSIFAWNLVDEVAENGRAAAEVAYVRSLSAWLHRYDPTRLVAVDVWGDHPPSSAGPIYGGADAVAETDYTGWYDDPTASASTQRAQMRARLRAMERTFAGKVLVISEFGAEANTLNPPGSAGSYAFQTQLLERHIKVYERDPKLSGMLIWNLRDYPLIPVFRGGSILAKLPHVRLIEGLLQKGLFTYAATPKPAAGAIARLFKALPAG